MPADDAALVYAGVLEEGGLPVNDLARPINVIVKRGGTQLCATGNADRAVVGGRFRVALPAACAEAIRDNQDAVVVVEVDGSPLGDPAPIVAVPFALQAGEADSALIAGAVAGGSIDAAALQANAVGSVALVDNAVTSAKLADGAVATTDLADDAVTAAKLADGSVGSVDIANGSVLGGDLSAGAAGANLEIRVEQGAGCVRLIEFGFHSTDCTCAPNEVAIGGGGFSGLFPDRNFLRQSQRTSARTWRTGCLNGDAAEIDCPSAQAICVRVSP